MDKKIGLIGVGNMGSAILEGVLEKQIVASCAMSVFDKVTEKSQIFAKKWQVKQADTVQELVAFSDVILLAVKPQDLEITADSIRSAGVKNKIVISILAGTSIAKIQALLEGARIVRAMPNLGAKVGESITALTSADGQAFEAAKQLFSGCGTTIQIEEAQFNLITAVSGSGPAYFFYLMERLVAEAEANGIAACDAKKLAIQTALGAALLAKSSQQSPRELREMVTSKGGTTEAALKVMKEKGFESLFHDAIRAATKRGEELNG